MVDSLPYGADEFETQPLLVTSMPTPTPPPQPEISPETTADERRKAYAGTKAPQEGSQTKVLGAEIPESQVEAPDPPPAAPSGDSSGDVSGLPAGQFEVKDRCSCHAQITKQ